MEANGRGNQFECYMRSTKYRQQKATLEGEHAVENARFEVHLTLGSGNNIISTCSRPTDTESAVSEKFYDKTVPAFDLRDSNVPIKTTMGAFYNPMGKRRTTLVEWPKLGPSIAYDSIWWKDLNFSPFWERWFYFCVGQEGVYRNPEHELTSKYIAPEQQESIDQNGNGEVDTGELWTANEFIYPAHYQGQYKYQRPYWSQKPYVAKCQALSKYTPNGRFLLLTSDQYTSVDAPENRKAAFEDCSLTCIAARPKTGWDLNAQAAPSRLMAQLRMEQRHSNPYHDPYWGTYVSRILGVRYGGAFFVSYPGRDQIPVCLKDENGMPKEILVPGSSTKIREKVMDLTDEKGNAQIITSPATWAVTLKAGPQGYDEIAWVGHACALGAAIPGPHQTYFAVTSGFLQACDRQIDKTESKEIEGRVRGWWAIRGRGRNDEPNDIGISGFPPNLSDAERSISIERKTVEKTQLLLVGQQLSVWAELRMQGQLAAMDSGGPGFVHSIEGIVKAKFEGESTPDLIKVVCTNN